MEIDDKTRWWMPFTNWVSRVAVEWPWVGEHDQQHQDVVREECTLGLANWRFPLFRHVHCENFARFCVHKGSKVFQKVLFYFIFR